MLTSAQGSAMAAAVSRHNRAPRKQSRKAIKMVLYHKAINAMRSKAQWYSGETVSIAEGTLRGLPARVYLKNQSGFVSLFVAQLKKTGWITSPGLTIGVLGFNDSNIAYWHISEGLDEAKYARWHTSVTKILK